MTTNSTNTPNTIPIINHQLKLPLLLLPLAGLLWVLVIVVTDLLDGVRLGVTVTVTAAGLVVELVALGVEVEPLANKA